MKKELILITGSGQGIGKFLAEGLIKNYDLILISKSVKCKILSKKINSKNYNNSNYIILDFNKKINVQKIIDKINFKDYSNINLIFAAGYLENFSDRINISEWKKVFNINLFAHLEILNSLLPFLKKINLESRVFFFSGGGAANDFSEFPAYSASKTAIVRTVENLSIKYKNYKISFIAIAPGAIKTRMLNKVLKYSKVSYKTTKKDILEFINYYLNKSSIKLNGRLIHILDNKSKINKNKNVNFLKLRRVEN